jgi:gluconolactonase
MDKKLHILPIFFLLLTALAACGRPPAALPPATVHQAQPTLEQVATPTRAPAASISVTNSLPQSFDLVSIPGSYQFTEGPATDANGNVYFSDISAGKIYRWSIDGSVSVFLEGLNKPNGLMFDKSGSLVACEGGAGRLISIDPQGKIAVLADKYNGTRFNEPNDLWIDPQGGIYFTDPAFQSPVVQDGEHVYYLSPDRSQLTRVISDLTRPNGLVGTADGKTLYVADHGAGQTFAYTINADGTLTDKRLFTATGSDGMDLDKNGNLYLTNANQVKVFDASGKLIRSIPTAETPTNVAFAGADGSILFITARTQVYTAQMSASSAATVPQASGFTLTSPDLPADGHLPAEYTCDGAASTLALAWSGAPAGTVGYVVTMHHNAPDNAIHFYWEVYNLPASVTSLPKNVSGLGSLGTNSVNGRNEYTPPCSKGPGDKEYIYTVYALSAQPQFSVPAAQIDRAAVLAAIQDITIASAELHVVYARP